MATEIPAIDKAFPERAIGGLPSMIAHFLNRELGPLTRQMRDRLAQVIGQLALGALNLGGVTLVVDAGLPAASDKTTGATNGWVYLRTDGGAGSTLYVYEGGGWAAK